LGQSAVRDGSSEHVGGVELFDGELALDIAFSRTTSRIVRRWAAPAGDLAAAS
jgi:hypothetical protein